MSEVIEVIIKLPVVYMVDSIKDVYKDGVWDVKKMETMSEDELLAIFRDVKATHPIYQSCCF